MRTLRQFRALLVDLGRALYQFSDMLIDPVHPDTWYLASFPTGLYKSTDAGETWQSCSEGRGNTRGAVANNVAVNLVMDCEGRYLYFGTMGSGVWRARLY